MQLIPSVIIDRVKKQKDFRKIVSNTGWLFADRILRMGIGLFVGVWIARYLGAEKFGSLNYASAFVGLFGALSNLGLPSIVVRTITHNPEKKYEILGTAFWLQIVSGITNLLLIFVCISIFRYGDELTIKLVLILASAGVFRAFNTIDFWFQSQVQSKYSVIPKNFTFIVFITLKIILISIGAPLTAFAWIQAVEVLVSGIALAAIYIFRGDSLLRWRWNLSLARNLLTQSWPLILSSLAITIYMKVDQIMLGEMLDSNAVGLYASAARISEAWYFIPTAIVSSVAPSIYAAKKENNSTLYYRKISNLLRVLSLTAVMIAIPMTFLSTSIVTTLFGSTYEGASAILAIHIWAALFVFLGTGASTWFIAEGLTRLSFARTLTGAVVNVALNIFLIPHYAGSGAAVATVLSYAVAGFLANYFNSRTRKIFLIQLQSLNILALRKKSIFS